MTIQKRKLSVSLYTPTEELSSNTKLNNVLQALNLRLSQSPGSSKKWNCEIKALNSPGNKRFYTVQDSYATDTISLTSCGDDNSAKTIIADQNGMSLFLDKVKSKNGLKLRQSGAIEGLCFDNGLSSFVNFGLFYLGQSRDIVGLVVIHYDMLSSLGTFSNLEVQLRSVLDNTEWLANTGSVSKGIEVSQTSDGNVSSRVTTLIETSGQLVNLLATNKIL
jgi:hypothetical protein